MTAQRIPGSPKPPGEGPHYWTMHTSSRSIRYVSHDNGETWEVTRVVWAEQRAENERIALEQQAIQRDLK